MESQNPPRAGASSQPNADDDAARLAKRVQVERAVARLAKVPVEDPTLVSTIILIVAAVAIAAIVAALYIALR
jgi:hypothetical protein